MTLKWQALLLVILILTSLTLTRLGGSVGPGEIAPSQISEASSNKTIPNLFSFQRAVLTSNFEPVQKIPARRWDVQDPQISAYAVLVQSLDDSIPLYYNNTHEPWTLASLTKLLTAVVIIEEVGINKKIPISKEAIATEGIAGNLASGEVYTARDLLKIMLLTSSNDAAAAFEEYLGGKTALARKLTKKAFSVGMLETVIEDGSGLDDSNKGTTSDFLKLTTYIIKQHPEIFVWTRTAEFLVQPINDTNAHTVYNINTLVERRDFLGGKTGTSSKARQNIVSVFNVENHRIAVILFGSWNRIQDVETLLSWVQEAYIFN